MSLHLQERGRQRIVAFALASAIMAIPMDLVYAIYYHFEFHHWLYGPAYVLNTFAERLASGVAATIFPLFYRNLFKRPEVINLFAGRSPITQ